MAFVLALVGLVGLLQGSVWLGTKGRKDRLVGRRRRVMGAAIAPAGLMAMVIGLTLVMVPDFFGGR